MVGDEEVVSVSLRLPIPIDRVGHILLYIRYGGLCVAPKDVVRADLHDREVRSQLVELHQAEGIGLEELVLGERLRPIHGGVCGAIDHHIRLPLSEEAGQLTE